MADTINVTIRLNKDIKEQAELNRRIADVEAGKNLATHNLIEISDE